MSFVFVGAILALACDPTRFISVVNKTDKPAQFIWVLKSDSLTSDSVYLDNYKKDTYLLDANKKEVVFFGWGTWSNAVLKRFVMDDVKSIEFESINGKTTITDKLQIMDFFRKGRHGVFKNFIRIKIE